MKNTNQSNRFHRWGSIVCVLAGVVLATMTAEAGWVYWIWDNEGVDNNWSTAANWSNTVHGINDEEPYDTAPDHEECWIGKYPEYQVKNMTVDVDQEEAALTSLIVCWNWGGVSTLNLKPGGKLNCGAVILGRQGAAGEGGVCNQSGGTNRVTSDLSFGSYGAFGMYNLTAGTVHLDGVSARLWCGRVSPSTGSGEFNMGNASGTGLITGTGYMIVYRAGIYPAPPHVNAKQQYTQFKGWGPVELTGSLQNDSRIIADGYGTDRTLSMTNFSYVTNSWENATDETNGWYAVDHGRLELPALAVTNTGVVNWGETLTDPTVDLVNSIGLDITTHTADGDFAIALLATNRAEVTTRNFGPDAKMIGVWEIDSGTFSGSVDLTFRYDHALASVLGITESELKVYRYSGTNWKDLTTGVDTVNKLIAADGISAFSLFAIGTDLAMPPAGTVVSVR